jgi:hypothetical protein
VDRLARLETIAFLVSIRPGLRLAAKVWAPYGKGQQDEGIMFNRTAVVIDAFVDELRKGYISTYTNLEPPVSSTMLATWRSNSRQQR